MGVVVFLVVVLECLCVAVFCDVDDVADCKNPDCCRVLLSEANDGTVIWS